jgi:peptidoglycan glycosyltransferase
VERRIRWLGLFLLLCFVLLFLQLNKVQVVDANQLANAPGNPRVVERNRDQPRGSILSADGTVLAQSVVSPLYSSTCGCQKYERQYPTDSLFEDVVGYDSPIDGMTGVEAEYNQYLEAHSKPVTTFGDLLANPSVTDDVTLTVSPSLQALAQKELGDRAGAVVVLDPTTGAVEALYSSPSFDPNGLASPFAATENSTYTQADTPLTMQNGGQFTPLNPVAEVGASAPGSTFKVITTAAVYDTVPQYIDYQFPYVDEIPLPGTNLLFHNYGFGTCGGDIAVMLPVSCDTGYAQLGLKVGGQNLYNEATGFGFDKIPPIDLPTNPYWASTFPSPSTFTDSQATLAYSAIGQEDVTASALQMALVASGIADQGVIMTPHVLDAIRDSQGNLVKSYQPTPWLTATSNATASAIGLLMHQVTVSGTAAGIFPESWDVAAKTGTAEVGANAQLTNDWMIAFAPENQPTVAVAVYLPDQPADATGASNSGPIMKAILQATLGEQ